jgi:hypothetical protein
MAAGNCAASYASRNEYEYMGRTASMLRLHLTS